MEEFEMLGRKYPDLEKPIFCAKKLSLYEQWRDIRFHKNLWKVDERMRELYLREEAQKEGREEGLEIGLEQGREIGHAEGLAEGHAEGLTKGEKKANKYVLELIAQGVSVEDIKKCLEG
jgi:flagellar biosynthesis/type III secretory pathway protein FliH